MKKVFFNLMLLVIVALLMAQDPPSNPSASLQDFNDVLVSWEPPGGAPVALWNQMDNPSTAGISAQDFETSYNQYDAMGADDFIVPAGETWSIFEIDILSFYSAAGGPCDLANVRFYADNGGTPGAVLHEFLDVAANPDETGNLFCTIPDTEFTEGTYWLSIQGRMDYATGEQFYWTRQMAPAVESEFFWQNPEDGFATGFTTWSIASTVWTDEPDINLSFVIYGTTTNEDGVTTVYGNRNGFASSKIAKHVNNNQRQGRLSIPSLSAVNEAYSQTPLRNSRSLAGYKIYQDGVEVAEVPNPITLTYLVECLDAGTYEFTITAFYTNPDEESVPTAGVNATVVLNPPSNGVANSNPPNIVVTWSAPARGVDSYNVYRDGVLHEEGVTGTTMFIDIAVPAGDYIYNLTAVYDGNWESEFGPNIPVDHTSGDGILLPTVTKLTGNYPNPFNPTTTISFSLKEAGHVSVNIYNMRGQLVKTLVNAELDRDFHEFVWDGRDNSGKTTTSGVYFYKMKAQNYNSTKKMILMK